MRTTHLENLLTHKLEISVIEGRPAGQHLKDESPEAPPIHSFAIALTTLPVDQHLWSQILGSSAEGCGSVGVGDLVLAETEVGDVDVTWRKQREEQRRRRRKL